MLQRAHHAVVHAALQDDADLAFRRSEKLVEFASRMNSSAAGQRFSTFSFSWSNEAGGSTMRPVSRLGLSSASRNVKGRALVVLGDETAVDVAGADAHLEHDRRIRHFRQFEAVSTASTIEGRLGAGPSARSAISSRKRGCAPA